MEISPTSAVTIDNYPQTTIARQITQDAKFLLSSIFTYGGHFRLETAFFDNIFRHFRDFSLIHR